jgi:alkylhydroperoxidase family enzyme
MTWLGEPPQSAGRDRLYEADRDGDGYVSNLTRLWAWRPDVADAFAGTRVQLQESWSLTETDRAVLVAATAKARGDSYCSLAWGATLAELAGELVATGVLTGDLDALDERQCLLARWADMVVRDPNSITEGDVAQLRHANLDDRAIFEATAFVGLRLAFSTVNDALGAKPDAQLAARVPASVHDAVTYGRPPATESPSDQQGRQQDD